MVQRLSNSFIQTAIPGAYVNVNVKSSASGVGVVGSVAIIGEAASGAKFSSEDLKNNYFSADQVASVVAKYGSGNIVDAFRALSVSSADSDILGAPARIYIFKTNGGTKASSSLPSYGSVAYKKEGLAGNAFFYTISEAQAEVAPSITGSALVFTTPADFTNMKFGVRLNGAAVVTVDVLTGATTAYDTIAEMAALIDAALPSGMSCSASTSALKIEVDTDASSYSKGFSKSFELVELHTGDLAVLGLDAGLVSSSSEDIIEMNIQQPTVNANESILVGGNVCFKLGYIGTTASMTISDSTLTTTVAGGTGSSLSIDLTKYPTIGTLVDYINSQAGYIAEVDSSFQNLSPVAIDNVTVGCCSSIDGIFPAQIKKDNYDFKKALSTSIHFDLTSTAVKGLPTVASKTYLSGGLTGASSNLDFSNCFTALESLSISFVIPLVSQDAVLDIADGATDSASTYTIDSVNMMAKSHVLKLSTPKMKKHRLAMVSKIDTFNNLKKAVGTLSNSRVSLCLQKVRNVNSAGEIKIFAPWMGSCIAAGMQSAGFYKGIVHKYANVVGFIDPMGFDSGSIGDMESALESGLLFMEETITGSRWVSDQTSYGIDTNFVYNSLQAMFCSDVIALDIAQSFDTAFVGKSLADVDSASALSFLSSKMRQYFKLKLITGSNGYPAGYKDATISINGPVMEVGVNIFLASSLYFVSINLDISQVSNSASE